MFERPGVPLLLLLPQLLHELRHQLLGLALPLLLLLQLRLGRGRGRARPRPRAGLGLGLAPHLGAISPYLATSRPISAHLGAISLEPPLLLLGLQLGRDEVELLRRYREM